MKFISNINLFLLTFYFQEHSKSPDSDIVHVDGNPPKPVVSYLAIPVSNEGSDCVTMSFVSTSKPGNYM